MQALDFKDPVDSFAIAKARRSSSKLIHYFLFYNLNFVITFWLGAYYAILAPSLQNVNPALPLNSYLEGALYKLIYRQIESENRDYLSLPSLADMNPFPILLNNQLSENKGLHLCLLLLEVVPNVSFMAANGKSVSSVFSRTFKCMNAKITISFGILCQFQQAPIHLQTRKGQTFIMKELLMGRSQTLIRKIALELSMRPALQVPALSTTRAIS